MFIFLLRAGSKDGETGLDVEPAKARETESFLHEVYAWYRPGLAYSTQFRCGRVARVSGFEASL